MRIVALLLLSALAVAEEPDASKQTRPINANLENVGPATAARMLKKAAGLSVVIAPQAAAWKANLRLVGVPTSMAMESLAEHFHCEVRFLGKKRWHVAPKWQFTLLDQLDKSMGKAPKIAKQPIDDVLETIRAGAGVDITLDRAVDRALVVSAPAKKRTYRKLLDQVVKKSRLKWELRYGVVYVADAKRLKQLPILVPELKAKKLRDHRLKLALKAVPLKRVGAQLGIGTMFVVAEEHGDKEIAVQAADITLPQALALMLYPEGLTVTETDEALNVRKLPPR
ncbi:MAG: hypothetical protein ACYS0E_10480 [Planctomycetota bacterium]|jgi:hypothetical protein